MRSSQSGNQYRARFLRGSDAFQEPVVHRTVSSRRSGEPPSPLKTCLSSKWTTGVQNLPEISALSKIGEAVGMSIECKAPCVHVVLAGLELMTDHHMSFQVDANQAHDRTLILVNA